MKQRWLGWVYLVIGAVVLGSTMGAGLWWWQQQRIIQGEAPRYRVAIERPLTIEGSSARVALLIMHLGTGEDPIRVAQHYLQTQAPQADLYQMMTPYGNVLIVRTATFPDLDKLPEQVRKRLVPWQKATRAGQQGPYALYRLEK